MAAYEVRGCVVGGRGVGVGGWVHYTARKACPCGLSTMITSDSEAFAETWYKP